MVALWHCIDTCNVLTIAIHRTSERLPTTGVFFVVRLLYNAFAILLVCAVRVLSFGCANNGHRSRRESLAIQAHLILEAGKVLIASLSFAAWVLLRVTQAKT